MRDEYDHQPEHILHSLNEHSISPDNDSLTQFFKYIETCFDPEIDSSVTNYLTSICQRWLNDAGITTLTRVIVLRRGSIPRAFVAADGTIFISQSLINALDYLDEVAGVLAHEVEHIINNTNAVICSVSALNEIGVRWTHEMSSDLFTTKLLSQAGLNSTGLASAVKKIVGNSRGTEHQSGAARSSQIIAMHYLVDQPTSHLKFTPLPAEFRKKVAHSNKDILNNATQRQDIQLYKKVIAQMHVADLDSEYESVTGKFELYPFYEPTQFEIERLVAIEERLMSRLKSKNISINKSIFFILGRSSSRYQKYRYPMVKSPKHLVEIINEISELLDRKSLGIDATEATKGVIDISSYSISDLLSNFLKNIAYIISDPHPTNQQLTFKEGELLFTLQALIELNNSEKAHDIRVAIQKACNDLFFAYVSARCIKNSKNVSPNEIKYDYLYALLKLVESLGVVVDTQMAVSSMYVEGKEYTYDLWLEVIDNVFSLSSKKVALNTRIEAISTHYDASEQLNENEFTSLLDEIQTTSVREKWSSQKRRDAYFTIAHQVNSIPINRYVDIKSELAKEKDETFALHDRTDAELATKGEMNRQYFNYYLLIILSFQLFEDDDDLFYECISHAVNQVHQDWGEIPNIELENLCQPLLTLPHRRSCVYIRGKSFSYLNIVHACEIKKYNQLYNLKPLKELIKRHDTPLEFSSLDECVIYLTQKRNCLVKRQKIGTVQHEEELYENDLFNVFIWKRERVAIINLINDFILSAEENVQSADINLPQLFLLLHEVNKKYVGALKTSGVLQKIALRYLHSPHSSLGEKVDFYDKYKNIIGPEGALIIGEHIHTIEEYLIIRKRLGSDHIARIIAGDESMTKFAAIDIMTSGLGAQHENIFETILNAPIDQEKNTTRLASQWLQYNFSGFIGQSYLPKRGIFHGSDFTKSLFIAFSDLVEGLHALSASAKAIIAHKALTEVDGALSSIDKRNSLSKLFMRALNLNPDSLQAQLAKAMIVVGKVDILSFPVSQVLGPMLFKSIQPQEINYRDLLQLKILNIMNNTVTSISETVGPEKLKSILKLKTHELITAEAELGDEPDDNSIAANHIGELNSEFYAPINALQAFLDIDSKEPTQPTVVESPEEKIDDSSEALIQAAQLSSAVIIRQLQLSSQFYGFKPNVRKRISNTLDSNPGMSMLAAWENLHLWSTPEPGDSSTVLEQKAALKNYLGKVRIHKKIAGGSLNTIFSATNEESGRDIVVRIQNPSAAFFIESGYELVADAYNHLERHTGERYKTQIKIGRMLNEMARQWCLGDINDPYYLEHDALFRRVIEEANTDPELTYYAPKLDFTSEKVKSEDSANGQTTNKLVRNTRNEAEKIQAVQALVRFFEHQLKFEERKIIAPDGSEYILVHSDQHMGNYMDAFADGRLQKAVIDRNMFLKLEREDLAVIEAYLNGSRRKEFVSLLIERILDKNKYRGNNKRMITTIIYARLLPEFTKQSLSGSKNELALLQIVFESCAVREIQVPLELQLMLRNASAYKELKKEFAIQ